MSDDIGKAALSAAMGGGFGLSTGGGAVTPSSSASSENKGGTNSLGGFRFGNYNASKDYTPWIIAAAAVAVVWYMTKGKRR